jgi:hypothetical protein
MLDALSGRTPSADPLDGLELRYHNAMPGWCKIVGLKIRTVPACEGAGFMIEREQALAIMALIERKQWLSDT